MELRPAQSAAVETWIASTLAPRKATLSGRTETVPQGCQHVECAYRVWGVDELAHFLIQLERELEQVGTGLKSVSHLKEYIVVHDNFAHNYTIAQHIVV